MMSALRWAWEESLKRDEVFWKLLNHMKKYEESGVEPGLVVELT